MQDTEIYATARTLATVEFCGETFRVVRKRINGKPWRKYLTLCHGDISVSSSIPNTTDPIEAAECYRVQLDRAFPSREALLLVLQDILKKNASVKAA